MLISSVTAFSSPAITLKETLIEAATGGVVSENVFSEISQNTQENTFAQVSFLIKVHDYEIFKNIFDVCFCIETSLPSFKPPI